MENHHLRLPVRDEDTGELIITAQIAETSYTAFTNPTLNPGQKTTGRLIARRTPIPTPDGQGQLITVYRYHAFLTDSPFDLITADAQHRGRAGAIEHIFADLQTGPLAHFPSGDFQANAGWLTLAALTHNLIRALRCLAGGPEATARTATLRRRLITVAARISRSARRLTLHLPRGWSREHTWQRIFTATHPPPTPA